MHSPTRLTQRQWFNGAAVVSALPWLAACSASPSRNILGSYFPTWMVCALLGLISVFVLRFALIKSGIDAVMPLQTLVYLCFWIAATLAIWLVWLG